MKKIILLFIPFIFLFASDKTCGDVDCVNTIFISSIADDANGNIVLTLSYEFEDEIAGFQFDILSDDIITFNEGSLSLSDDLNSWNYTKINSQGTVVGFDTGLSVLSGAGDLFSVEGSYDISYIGESTVLDAIENCSNGSGSLSDKCRKVDGDTRMVLSDSNADLINLSHFHEAIWNVGTCAMTL